MHTLCESTNSALNLKFISSSSNQSSCAAPNKNRCRNPNSVSVCSSALVAHALYRPTPAAQRGHGRHCCATCLATTNQSSLMEFELNSSANSAKIAQSDLTKLSSSWLAEKNGFSALVCTRHHIANCSLII